MSARARSFLAFRRKPQGGSAAETGRPDDGTWEGSFGSWPSRSASSSVTTTRSSARASAGCSRREPEIEVVGQAVERRGGDREDRSRPGRPDVLLLDVVMPGRSGIEVLPELLAAAPDTQILVLSMQDDPSYVRQVVRRRRDR